MKQFTFIVLLGFLCLWDDVHASNNYVVVDSIVISGNKKTKNRIILRELTFSKGDSVPLSMLSTLLAQNRLRILNTNLFLKVVMNVKNWTEDNHATISIEVIENWFFYPIPIFEIADRNFNVWWKEQGRSLKRTNYGMRLTYNNVTGRRDPLAANIQLGYTPRYSFSYGLPYINKKQTVGFNASYSNSVNREVGYSTEGNKLTFYKDASKFLLHRTGVNVGFNYNPRLLTNYSLTLGYTRNSVDSVIGNRLNTDYYLNNRLSQHFFWLSANYTYDNRDIRPYPMHGNFLNVNISKGGLRASDDLQSMDISTKFAHYFSLTPKWSLEMIVKGKYALIRQKQPYTSMRGLGYGSDVVRGYDYYVMDAMDYAYSKNSFRFQLINRDLDLKKWIPYKKLKNWTEMPLKSYLTFSFDTGYAHNPFEKASNKLTNRQLYGGGIGIDLIIYYNVAWRFEYNINHLGEKGLFFNYYLGF